MSSVSQYLFFQENPSDSGKTVVVHVLSQRSGIILGLIKWYGPWRQYCFYPWADTIFNKGCMEDIIQYIDKLMQERLTKRAEPATL